MLTATTTTCVYDARLWSEALEMMVEARQGRDDDPDLAGQVAPSQLLHSAQREWKGTAGALQPSAPPAYCRQALPLVNLLVNPHQPHRCERRASTAAGQLPDRHGSGTGYVRTLN